MTDATNPAGDAEETLIEDDLADERDDAVDPEDGPVGDWENIPEGTEPRDEEWEDDDPADVPVSEGGEQAGLDTDDDGVIDTIVPDDLSLIDEGDL